MLKRLPKFHDRKSLIIGMVAGLFLVFSGLFCETVIGLFQALIGLGLFIHCLDMAKYYQKHRIVRIEKTDTERKIYKENAKKDRSMA